MKKYYYFAFFWIFCAHRLPTCIAQCNEFVVYTTQNGLSGDELRLAPIVDNQQNVLIPINNSKINVIQKGYWIKVWGEADGFKEQNVDKLIQTKKNRIWCFGTNHEISFLDRQHWYSFPTAATMPADWQQQPALFDEKGQVYLYDTVQHVLKTPFQLSFIPKGAFLRQVLQQADTEDTYFFLNHGNADWIVHQQREQKDSIALPTQPAIWKLIEGNLVGYMPQLNQLWVSEGKKWTKYILPFPVNILLSDDYHLYFNQKVRDKWNVVSEWTPNNLLKKQFTCQYASELKGVAQDKNGLFWVSTAKGLLKIYPHLVHYKVDDYPILDELQAICEDTQHNIWFGSYAKGFSFMSATDDYSIQPVSKSVRFKKVMPSSLVLEDGRMLYSIENQAGILATNGTKWQTYPPQMVGFYFSRLKDGRMIWGTAGHGLAISEGKYDAALASKWRFLDEKKGYPFLNVLAAVEDGYGRIWMGRMYHGLAVYLPQKDTVLSWKVTNDPKSFGLDAAACDKYGNLWLGGLHGLHFLKNRADLDVYKLTFDDFQKISESVIGDKKIYSMQLYKADYLIVGTIQGFGILNLPNFYLGKQPQWLFFNRENGFSSETCEQNTLWMDDGRKGKGWIGHDKGATLADLDQLIAQFSTLSIQADSLKCGDVLKSNLKKDLNIPERAQESQIYFSSNEKSIVSFFYKIDDIGEYIYTPKPYISLPPTLNSGNHTLRLVAMAVDGNISEEKIFTVTIPYPFYQTWWFGSGIVSIFMGGLLYRNKMNQLQIKEQASQIDLQKTKMQLQASEIDLQESKIQLQASEIELQEFKIQLQKLESKVIVNQLNPHFLKNSFNFLQIRLKRFKDLLGVDYASKLDHTITSVFHQSVKGKLYHTLAEELTIVKNHLDMECMRYSKPNEKLIQYQIRESKIKDLMHIKIPLFQLQIHCENAVKHGLRNNEDTDGGGMIWIDFEEKNDYLFIYIQDNGVGRQKAIEIESQTAKNTNSGLGVKMLNQFHVILNEKNKDTQLAINQFYTDNIFINDDGEGYGTKVTIQLPKQNFTYEI